jgi:hypothetical protein
MYRCQEKRRSGFAAVTPGTGDWDAAAQAVQDLKDDDFNAWREQEYDLRHANDHRP